MLLNSQLIAAVGVVLQISLAFGNPTIMPDINPVFVLSPSTIMLTCQVDKDADIVWKKGDTTIADGGKYKINTTKTGAGSGTESKSTLAVYNPTGDDQGDYSCSDSTDSTTATTKIVKVLEVAATDANYTDGGTAVLECQPQNLQDEVIFTWKFNGTKIENDRAVISNYTLELGNLKPFDAGLYQCEFKFADHQRKKITTLVQDVNLFAAPYVEPFEKSKNMVQGDTLKLKCRVYGHPTPVVVWKRDGAEINQGEDERINIKDLEEDNKLVSRGGLLTIFDLQFEDRANYKCEANNTFGSGNSTILVRVKDKLAALWPFLGIVAEVAILCGIIFIYEKKRSKETEDEEDAPLQKTANAQDHKGKDEVRHRKA